MAWLTVEWPPHPDLPLAAVFAGLGSGGAVGVSSTGFISRP
ncbi:MAG: hypothetical protein BWX84_02004 [Verrucomicrobia bacterium ADurb.Bin118]|nr:MAG: hypothetical protein BWX84_02004 [Verrucomicrobia bacterium ADurb.Bin118]